MKEVESFSATGSRETLEEVEKRPRRAFGALGRNPLESESSKGTREGGFGGTIAEGKVEADGGGAAETRGANNVGHRNARRPSQREISTEILEGDNAREEGVAYGKNRDSGANKNERRSRETTGTEPKWHARESKERFAEEEAFVDSIAAEELEELEDEKDEKEEDGSERRVMFGSTPRSSKQSSTARTLSPTITHCVRIHEKPSIK